MRGAYFADYISVCQTEASCVLGCQTQHVSWGNLDLLECEISVEDLPAIARLSFVQGAFEISDGLLRPIGLDPQFNLPDDFVYGSKYRGKTNEALTQLLVNLGLRYAKTRPGKAMTVLDPMCGTGTLLVETLSSPSGVPPTVLAIGADSSASQLALARALLLPWPGPSVLLSD